MALMDFSLGASDPNNPNAVILTPQQQQARLAAALAQQKEGSDFSPVQSPWQGAARLAAGLMGGLEAGHIERQQAAATKGANDQLGSLIAGLGGAGAAPPAAPAASGSVSTGLPAFADLQGVDPSIKGVLTNSAMKYGEDPATLMKIAGIESHFDPNAKNPNSTAAGLLQFTKGTAAQYGVSNPMDPTQSADGGARLLHDNRVALASALGRDPTPGELYLAHQQGAGGAIKLLSNPEAPAASLVGNQAISLNGGSPGMTAGQFANLWTSRLDGKGGAQPAGASAYAPVQVASTGPLSGIGGASPAPGAASAAVPLPPPRPANLTAAADDGEEDTPAPAQVAGPGAPTGSGPAAAPAQAPAAAPVQNQAQLKAALAIMQNPYSSPAAQQIAGAVLQQAMKQDSYSQPYKDQFGNVVQRASNGEINILNSAPTTQDTQTADIKNFEYAKKNGFTGNFTDFETQQKAQTAGNHVIGTGGALVDPNGKVLYQNQGNGGFDDATVGALADRVIAGEGGVLVGLGRGAQGSENIGKVQAAVAQRMAAQNLSPDAIAKARADIAGKMQEQRTLGTSTANNTLYGDTAAAAMDTALKASASVPRGRWAPLNALANMGMKAWSDPNYGAFLTANNTLVSEYAKATSPVGSPTDSQRAHAFELLSTADSPEKYDRVVRMMHQEIENTHKAIGQAKTQLKSGNFELPGLQTPPPASSNASPGFWGTIGNAVGLGGGSAPASPPVIQDEAGFKALPSGAQFIGPDGKPYRKP